MTIKTPRGLKDCQILCKIMMDVFNLYALLQKEGKEHFFHCFFLKDWNEGEIHTIFSFVLDDDDLPFSDPAKREHITIPQYMTGLRMISDWFCEIDLPPFIKEEAGYMTLEHIERAIDRFISWKKDQETDLGEFILESLKTFRSRDG